MRVGILTSGGDCPGLNAVIRGAVLNGLGMPDVEFVGIRDGWRGIVDREFVKLERADVRGVAGLGGTILGSSRTNPLDGPGGGTRRVREAIADMGIDALVAIGGEGTLTVAELLHQDGIAVIGVPKTIDNDISGTDYSFGFDTAVGIATEAIDRIRTTAESHKRCIVVEVMGRNTGWIALHAGLAAGAHAILIPEKPHSIGQVSEWVRRVRDRDEAPLVVVAEAFRLAEMGEAHSTRGLDAFNRPRLGGIAEMLAPVVEEATGVESRSTALGYLQRGGAPSAYDRVLATRMGMAAAEAVRGRRWGSMLALNGTRIVEVPLGDAVKSLNRVPDARYTEAELLFG
ncbi:ATP-dependent 6-phosphofructokinase [Streptomyces sp. NPDC003393]